MAQKLDNCVSCGALVPGPTQEYPYDGHEPDCALVAGWLADEPGSVQHTIDTIQGLIDTVEHWQNEYEERTSQMKDVTCDKCGLDMGYGWSAEQHRTNLRGGYKATLCVPCVNLWTEHCTADTQIQALEKEDAANKAKQHAYTQVYKTMGPDKAEELANKLTPLIIESASLRDKFFVHAKAWAVDKIPTPAAPTP